MSVDNALFAVTCALKVKLGAGGMLSWMGRHRSPETIYGNNPGRRQADVGVLGQNIQG